MDNNTAEPAIGLYDSLPYIDSDISQAERDAASQLVLKAIDRSYKDRLHTSLQPLPDARFSELMQEEIRRCSTGYPRTGGIDTSRYEAPDGPSDNAHMSEWKAALKNAYVLSTYLSGRRSNLALLEEFGKNAWLIGNYELETQLKRSELELAEVKAQAEEINKARKIAQENSRGEMVTLDDMWKKGIGKIIEVQVATEQLKTQMGQRKGQSGG